MKLPIIPQDKGNHFIYGFVIFFLSNLFLNELISLIIVVAFAIGKEIYDEYKYGGFDWKDFIFTLIPALLLNLKQIIL